MHNSFYSDVEKTAKDALGALAALESHNVLGGGHNDAAKHFAVIKAAGEALLVGNELRTDVRDDFSIADQSTLRRAACGVVASSSISNGVGKNRILEGLLRTIETLSASMLKRTNSENASVDVATSLATKDRVLGVGDADLIDELEQICPTAASSYRQAISDLLQRDRHSWRGPATDLREALRELLDTLAPDESVMKAPGFKFEDDAKKPTMRQKTRHALKTRGVADNRAAPSIHAAELVEEILSGITRSVYTRLNVSTHSLTSRSEVIHVYEWVRLIIKALMNHEGA